MSFGRKMMAVVAVMGMLAGVVLLAGCADKKVNPYTNREASLDVAKEDHAAAGEKLESTIKTIVADAVKTQAEELDAAKAREVERQRRFELERGKLERAFAAQRAVTQAEHENIVADLAVARDADVASYYAAAKVAGDDAQRSAIASVQNLRDTYEKNDKIIRDWERDWKDQMSKLTLGLDVASAVAGTVPGGGLAQTAITALGTLLLGGAGMTAVNGRRSRKRVDDAYEEGRKVGYEAASKEREAADAAWDESQKRSQPDPNVAAVTNLTTAILSMYTGKGAPSSPAGPASKDAA